MIKLSDLINTSATCSIINSFIFGANNKKCFYDLNFGLFGFSDSVLDSLKESYIYLFDSINGIDSYKNLFARLSDS